MLDLDLAKRFTWLLRTDVRKGKKSSDTPDEAFMQWWLVQGRAEYPYWSYLNDAQKLALFESAGKMPVGKLEQAVPKIMQLVLSRRPDVIQKFSVEKNVNVQAVAGWFWVMGLIEHALTSAVALDTIRELDRPVLVDASLDPNPAIEAPSPTVLMSIAWHLIGPEMQAQMDLTKSESRYRYLCWFFAVARPLFKFEAIIANRWKSWLLQLLSVDASNAALGELPRFALMECALMDSKIRPNLKTAAGVEQLRVWSVDVIKPRQKWAWLKEKIAYQDNGLPVDTKPIWRPIAKEAAQPPLKKRAFGVNLFGFALGELGLGEDLRMAVAVCQAAKVPYNIINISPGQEIGQGDKALAEELEKGPNRLVYPINIFCMPGFDVAARVYLKFGEKAFENHYNIGWWPWELGVWPKAWQGAFELVDELWGCSQFSYEMYTRSTQKPVIAMPLATSIERVKAYPRKHFGLPIKPFLFLYVFDFNSHLERKNPLAAIAAFQKAFSAKESVGLVLKVMNGKSDDPHWLSFIEKIKLDKRIHLLSKTLERSEVLGLIQACDAYVSPHRAEGFGRTLTEAMLMGKPVVATNYSGNQFFMNPDVSFPVDFELAPVKAGDYHFVESEDGAVWANPSIDHMASQLRAAMHFAKKPEAKALIAQYAASVFSPQRTADLMLERLGAVQKILAQRNWL
jgi:glycosyltransferase involved in cell wall biosynthesis